MSYQKQPESAAVEKSLSQNGMLWLCHMILLSLLIYGVLVPVTSAGQTENPLPYAVSTAVVFIADTCMCCSL